MVTGAFGGIGVAVLTRLAAAGATLSTCDIRTPEAPATPGPVCVAGNLADPAVARSWTEQTLAEHGRIDGLVNVAGIWRSSPFGDITADELSFVLGANLTTTWNACQAVMPHLLAAGSGSIVNFSSTAGQTGSVRPAAHYAAAKGAVIALTKSLAREVSPHGVRVNAISPGPVDTGAAGSGVDFDDTEVRNRTLLRRVGRPEEIADGVLYLVSDASSYATGTVLCVNGGSQL